MFLHHQEEEARNEELLVLDDHPDTTRKHITKIAPKYLTRAPKQGQSSSSSC